MKRTEDLLSSFDKSWEDFSAAWKKARAKASEKSIHDLRVSTRRLIAILELARGVSRRAEIPKLRRRFKKVLKRMGPLRDVQVQLENVGKMPQSGLIAAFRTTLERRERRKVEAMRDELKRGTKRRLSKDVLEVREAFSRWHESLGDEKIHHSIERVLTQRQNEFLKAGRRFHRVQPFNEDLLHKMRIALKKFRYAVEAAQPVLGGSAKERARKMHAFQQLMGESRDVAMLVAELEKWAGKKGKRIAIVPALDRLQAKKETMLKKIIESSTQFQEMFKTETLKPVTEKTHAVGSPPVAVPETDRRPAPSS